MPGVENLYCDGLFGVVRPVCDGSFVACWEAVLHVLALLAG